MSKVYYDSIKVGDMLSPVLKSALTKVQVSQFAAATNDYNPMCIDEHQAKAKGYIGTCAHVQIGLAYAEECLRHFGKNMRIFEITGTFQKLLWPGDMLTAKGIISNHYEKEDEHRIDVDLWVENQNQDTVLKGKATCVLFKNPSHEKTSKSKLPPLSEASLALD